MTNKLNHICIGPSIPPCSLLDSENFQVNIIKQKLQNRIQVLIEKKNAGWSNILSHAIEYFSRVDEPDFCIYF